jgi:hypothetical protein
MTIDQQFGRSLFKLSAPFGLNSDVDTAVVIFVCVLVVALSSIGIWALISAARMPGYAWQRAERSKAGTIFGILLTGGIGGVYYWLSIRGPVKAARDYTPPRREARSVEER